VGETRARVGETRTRWEKPVPGWEKPVPGWEPILSASFWPGCKSSPIESAPTRMYPSVLPTHERRYEHHDNHDGDHDVPHRGAARHAAVVAGIVVFMRRVVRSAHERKSETAFRGHAASSVLRGQRGVVTAGVVTADAATRDVLFSTSRMSGARTSMWSRLLT
jgi:hypothetical protein